MTLFTKPDCARCDDIKERFELEAMQVNVEVLDGGNAEALAHLAWHGLVETARKSLPILVLDDSSSVADAGAIEAHLINRANQRGVAYRRTGHLRACEDGSCALQN